MYGTNTFIDTKTSRVVIYSHFTFNFNSRFYRLFYELSWIRVYTLKNRSMRKIRSKLLLMVNCHDRRSLIIVLVRCSSTCSESKLRISLSPSSRWHYFESSLFHFFFIGIIIFNRRCLSLVDCKPMFHCPSKVLLVAIIRLSFLSINKYCVMLWLWRLIHIFVVDVR